MIIINAENQVNGRLASTIANKLLHSTEKIIIVNSKKIFISGNKKKIVKAHLDTKDRGGKGNPLKNPTFIRYPDAMFKRTVRGMLPRNNTGLLALKRLMVYIDVPEEYSKNLETAIKLKNIEHVTLEELSKKLGANIK